MKKRIFNFILSIFLIIPCMFAFSGCNQANKAVRLEGKSIVFDRVEDLQWDAMGMHVLKVIDGDEYEAMLTTQEVVELYWNSEAFARGLGSNTSFNSLEEAKTALRNKAFSEYRDIYSSYKISQDGLTVTEYDWSDTSFSTPIATYQARLSNTEFGYSYDITLTDGEGHLIILSEPDYIRCSGSIEGKSTFLTGFVNETITMKSENGDTREVRFADFPENADEGFQFNFFVNGKNHYKIVE